MQMDFIPGCDFTDPCPVLPEGVAQCKGFGRLSWITKCVTLMNESGVDVARVFAIVSKQTSSLTATACGWVMTALLFKSLSRWWRTKSHRSGCFNESVAHP
jgi:hypothetical protein